MISLFQNSLIINSSVAKSRIAAKAPYFRNNTVLLHWEGNSFKDCKHFGLKTMAAENHIHQHLSLMGGYRLL